MQSGLWVDSQRRYDQLVASDRLTLSTAFKRAGWRTVDDVPSNDRDVAAGRVVLPLRQGLRPPQRRLSRPPLRYASMPDQYVLSALQRLELAKRHRRPLSRRARPGLQPRALDAASHAGRLGRRSATAPSSTACPQQEPSSPRCLERPRTRTRGLRPVDRYTMSALVSFVQHYGDKNLVLVVLGDHQPARSSAGRAPSHDVPISVIAHDPAVLDRIARLGLARRPAAQPAGAGLADERLPRPLPERLLAMTPAARQRLAGLDGIRGLAALFVVVNHVFLRAFPGYPVDHAPFWAAPFIYGRFAVVVFIVLSGFSLALSPARHGWRLDGIRRFARRRAWRILPAYWAALAFSLAVAWMVVAAARAGARRARSPSWSTACSCRTSSARRARTARSGRWRSRPSSTSCSRCCC